MNHTVEEFPQLIAKWHDRNMVNKKPPQNANPNIQKIYVELRNPNIVFAIKGFVATEGDQEAPYRYPRVQPTPKKKVSFYVQI